MFKPLLLESGFILQRKGSNEIKLDEADFIRKLESLLKEDLSYPDNLQAFAREMAEYLSNQELLMQALMPTLVEVDALETTRRNVSNSLVRILLLVLDLQPMVIDFLLDKIEQMSAGERPTSETRKIALLMLNSLRYLPRIIQPDKMTEKLIHLISTVPRDFKVEIISVLPGLCAENQHSKIAIFLSSVFYECSDLTTCILGSLSDLYVPPEEIGSVRANVMKRLSSLGTEDLPNAIQFILQDLADSDIKEVVIQLRDALNDKYGEKVNLNESCAMPSTLSKTPLPTQRPNANRETASLESITLDLLASSLGSNKTLTNVWLKVISAACDTSDLTSFDFLLLITCRSFFNSKKVVEVFLKNKIRLGLIKPKLIAATFQNHCDAIQGNRVNSCLELGEMFLSSSESHIATVGLAVFKAMFATGDSYVTQEIMFSITRAISSVTCDEYPIQLLDALVAEHPKTVLKYSMYLTGLFGYFDAQSLLKVRKIMDALSQLAFTYAEDNSQLSNDVFIFIRKHLNQSSLRFKKIGVVSAVMAARSLSQIPADTTQATVDTSTSSLVVTPSVKKAIELLELAKGVVAKNSEMEGLFLDELSNMVLHSVVSTKVLEWIRSAVNDEFLARFVKELEGEANVEELSDLVPLKLQYVLEPSEVAMSIGPFVCQKVKDSSTDVALISPFFRLMRLVDLHLNENLTNVDALLSCGAYMPTPEAIEEFSSATTKEKNIILNCLFLCLNFFRELINAFGPVKIPEYYHLVLKRISQVVEIQNTLTKLLNIHPSFLPPKSQYWVDVDLMIPSSVGKGRKRSKTAEGKGTKKQKTQTGTAKTQTGTAKTQTTQKKTSKTEEKKETKLDFTYYKEFVRELDIDTVQLFRRGFEVDEKAIERENLLKLGPKELVWLTEEILPKFQHILSTKKKAFGRQRPSGQFILVDQFDSKFIAKQAVKVTSLVCACMESASQYFQSLSALNDGDLDASTVLNDDSPIIGTCFSNCLKIVSTIFAWSGMSEKENYLLAKEALFHSAKRMEQSLSQKTKTMELADLALKYYVNYAPTLPYIQCATSQCQIIASIGRLAPSSSFKNALKKVIPEHLKREWRGLDGCRDHGLCYNQSLEYMLSESIKFVKKPFEYLDEIISGPMKEVLEANGKAAIATDLPSLSKQSFIVYYKCLFAFLVSSLRETCLQEEQPSEKVQLETCLKATELLAFFVTVTKTCGQRTYLAACLKNSRAFLDHFLKHGMSLIDSRFRSQRDDCIVLLKSIQASSRQMHHICSHTRVTKDVALSAHVPMLKKNLETFVYRVKAMLALNKCTDAFWMGNLKNRTLKGQELPSQVVSGDETDAEESALDEEQEVIEVQSDEQGSDQSDDDGNDPKRGRQVARSISPLY